MRPLGSLVERVSRIPRPARFALITRSAAYWTPERSPLIRLPPNRPPSYCWSVSVPTRKLRGEYRVGVEGLSIPGARGSVVGGVVSEPGLRFSTSRSTEAPRASEKLILNGLRPTTARAWGASTTIAAAFAADGISRSRSKQARGAAAATTLPSPGVTVE